MIPATVFNTPAAGSRSKKRENVCVRVKLHHSSAETLPMSPISEEKPVEVLEIAVCPQFPP